MLTLKNAEKRFITGMDVSPEQCCENGYMSLWNISGNILLAKIAPIHNNQYYVQYSYFHNMDSLKEYLIDTWNDISPENKQAAISYTGNNITELHDTHDYLLLADMIFSVGYLDWDISEYKPNYLRAIDFSNTYEKQYW